MVVTAERRTTRSSRTTAIAATVLTGADLAQKGVLTVDQLQFALPGATINNFGQGNDFNIRGIGKAEHNSGTTVGVITYRDGVATFPGYFQEEPYYDIANVEILRGPQGTFVGQNATGGAVTTSSNPVIGGGLTATLAGQSTATTTTPISRARGTCRSATLAARVAFTAEARDSFYHITGPFTGSNGAPREASFRVGLLWKPNAALSVLFKTDYNYLDLSAYPADPVNSTNDMFNITANANQKALDRFVRSDLKIELCAAVRHHPALDQWLPEGQHRLPGGPRRHQRRQFHLPRLGQRDRLVAGVQHHLAQHRGRSPGFWMPYLQSDQYNFLPGQFVIGVPPGSVFSEYRLQGTNPKRNIAGFGQVAFNLGDGYQIELGGRYSVARTTNHVSVSQYRHADRRPADPRHDELHRQGGPELDRQPAQLPLRLRRHGLSARRPERAGGPGPPRALRPGKRSPNTNWAGRRGCLMAICEPSWTPITTTTATSR